jgi:carbonic anhydrase
VNELLSLLERDHGIAVPFQKAFHEMLGATQGVTLFAEAGLHPADYEAELPLVALTCVDVRLNTLLPQALGVPPEQFIWLRNAGNIITGSMSSTMRSLALACVVKGGREIVIIGHTDCQVGKTSTLQLVDRFRALGIERHLLPDNLNEFFGLFGSEPLPANASDPLTYLNVVMLKKTVYDKHLVLDPNLLKLL